MKRGRGRLTVLVSVMVAALALAASPALAHFCFKTGWNDAAFAGAAKSQAWLTAGDWLGFLQEAEDEGFICPEGADVLRDALESAQPGTLFMGPGLLAGGTLKNGKGNTPAQVGYLPIFEAFEACGE